MDNIHIEATADKETEAEAADRIAWRKQMAEELELALCRAVELTCDLCGNKTGTYVDECDLNGSHFFCGQCGEKQFIRNNNKPSWD